MKPVNYNTDGNTRQDVSKDWFLGEPSLKDLTDKLGIAESKVFNVTFPNGSKTKMHYHQGGQMLIITKGEGSLVIFEKIGKGESKFEINKKNIIPLKEGSIQYIPAKILHIHGANPNSSLSHIAINYPAVKKTDEAETVWYESDFECMVTEKL